MGNVLFSGSSPLRHVRTFTCYMLQPLATHKATVRPTSLPRPQVPQGPLLVLGRGDAMGDWEPAVRRGDATRPTRRPITGGSGDGRTDERTDGRTYEFMK